jgi:subtilisin family serine protease
VNAAGNHAEGHWSGTFNDTNGDGYTEFAPGDEGNTFTWFNGEVICGFLKWDEWPAATSDFELSLVLSSTGQIIDSRTNIHSGPPFAAVCDQQNSGSDLTVAWEIRGVNVTTTPRLDLFSTADPLQYSTAAGSVIDPAASPNVLAAGALCWQTNTLEPYSSQGPTIDGRLKPDLAGHDSESSATYGSFDGTCPSGFAGTSAASPEVAGAAALVKQANPTFGPNEIESYLQQNATDLGATGPDDQTGAGALHLPAIAGQTDTTPPKAKALASSGRRGHVVKLLSRVSDNSGEVKIRDQVKRNGKVLKTFNTGFIAAATAQTGFFSWKVPAALKGSIQHCVRGQDKAGNLSAVSCAKVTLTG